MEDFTVLLLCFFSYITIIIFVAFLKNASVNFNETLRSYTRQN